MNAKSRDAVRWDTSAFGEPPLPSQAELAALKTQFEECRIARGRMFPLRCMVDAINDLFANRMMTLVVVVILFLCAASLLHLLR
jgi:hypothetical protein